MGSTDTKKIYRTPIHCHLIPWTFPRYIIGVLCKIPSYHGNFFNCNVEGLFPTFFTCCALWSRNARSFKRWYNFESLAWLYNFELHGMSVLPYSRRAVLCITAQNYEITCQWYGNLKKCLYCIWRLFAINLMFERTYFKLVC